MKVDRGHKGIVISNGRKYVKKKKQEEREKKKPPQRLSWGGLILRLLDGN